jgi:hypothetical protein
MEKNIRNSIEKFKLLKKSVGSVEILVVTKGINSQLVIDFIRETGHLNYGENYASELKKWDDILHHFPNLNLSFIGSFQSGNLKKIVKYCNKIESINSLQSLEKAKKEAVKQGKNLKYYAQINIGNEHQKNGFLEESLDVNELKEFDGIMCIPPAKKDPTPYFIKMREISQNMGGKEISMGMSKDYDLAISLGATEIRVGSLIFGEKR